MWLEVQSLPRAAACSCLAGGCWLCLSHVSISAHVGNSAYVLASLRTCWHFCTPAGISTSIVMMMAPANDVGESARASSSALATISTRRDGGGQANRCIVLTFARIYFSRGRCRCHCGGCRSFVAPLLPPAPQPANDAKLYKATLSPTWRGTGVSTAVVVVHCVGHNMVLGALARAPCRYCSCAVRPQRCRLVDTSVPDEFFRAAVPYRTAAFQTPHVATPTRGCQLLSCRHHHGVVQLGWKQSLRL